MTALVRRHPGALLGLLDAERTDQLTGAITYDTILHELSREIDRAAHGGLRLSCCFIDLDEFKRVNDRHDHLHGNGVLRQAAQVLREGGRSGDTIGRYGGDEFVAILPQTSAADARWLSERLRAQLAATRIPSLERPLTASVGVAEWTPGARAEQLLDSARFFAEVIDEGHGFSWTPPKPVPEPIGGWGLTVVAGESDRWGIYGGTTHVWSELNL